jgi:hypothetical protein
LTTTIWYGRIGVYSGKVVKLQCRLHPDYTAEKKPRFACSACWYLWKIQELLERRVFPDLQEVKK